MSGHSKWHSIKHQKATADARRGKIFTKLANEIASAAQTGADPKMNFKLRLAIAKAKAASMPAKNIERSIARGSGQTGSARLEDLKYEGFGPAGVAIMVKAVSDNRNRTGSAVKSIFAKMGGNLGASGSVGYQFSRKGVIILKDLANRDDLALKAIEAGASDIDDSGKQLIIYCPPNDLEKIKAELGEDNIESADIEMVATQKVLVQDPKKAASVLKLVDALDELDDVVEVAANFDIPDDIMAKLEG